MNNNEIYYNMCIPLKKFYIVDYLINYMIDTNTAQRYINEPYINPVLEELYDIYKDKQATPNEMLKPYINELIEKIEKADNDMYTKLSEYEYDFVHHIHTVLKKYNDLNLAVFMCRNELKAWQYDLIISHHDKFEE